MRQSQRFAAFPAQTYNSLQRLFRLSFVVCVMRMLAKVVLSSSGDAEEGRDGGSVRIFLFGFVWLLFSPEDGTDGLAHALCADLALFVQRDSVCVGFCWFGALGSIIRASPASSAILS